MLKLLLIAMVFTVLGGASSQAGPVPKGKTAAASPCDQIKTACKYSGFAEKGAKPGMNLWRDCITPIMQQPPGQRPTRVLPAVDPSVVAACKAKNPKFGQSSAGR